jgi:hypothetical protein
MDDREFADAMESCSMPAADFGHRQHLRLAWIYLRQYGGSAARDRIQATIRAYAAHLGVSDKYHVTITLAWMDLVERAAAGAASFEGMLEEHPELLNKNVLETLYSPELLKSEAARLGYVAPDRFRESVRQ